MYEIQHRRWYNDPKYSGNVLIASGISSLEEAREKRVCSGDLVVDSTTKKIVTDLAWLWDWEKDRVNCYARSAIAWQIKKNKS